jgi:hypothetical protein
MRERRYRNVEEFKRRVHREIERAAELGDRERLDAIGRRLRGQRRRMRLAGYRCKLKLAYLDLLHILGRED